MVSTVRLCRFWPGIALSLVALLVSCGGGGGGGKGDHPVPILASLSPTSATVGDTSLTLIVNGSNFISGSVVRWNGTDRVTTFVSATQLTAAIPASDIAVAGTAQVTVFNPTPGGGTSGPATFTINIPEPAISSLSPPSATVGAAGFILTVNGSGFVSASVVHWNGAPRATTFDSNAKLLATILDTDLAAVGTAQVTVFNPAPGGGTSNSLPFAIDNPAPTLTSLSPASATAGGPALTLTVNGLNFLSDSVVEWNGSPRPTLFVDGAKLEAAISAADLATPGTAQVTVFNPAPGGGTSDPPLPFTITTPAPTLSSLSPASATVGDPGLTLTVNGSNFLAASVVCWDGSPRPTLFVDGAKLEAAILDTDLAAAGTVPVTVCGEASALPFTINNPKPTLVNISPSSATAGDPTLTLTANGSNFALDSKVRWNGSDRPTTFGSSFLLTVTIPNTDLAAAGTAQVTVFNPTPGGGTSAPQTFTIIAPSPGVIERVSVAGDGTQGNDGSRDPNVSADGRFVAFSSRATNLVGGDTNGNDDIFVRDTCLGATGCTPSTIRASVATDGSQGTGAGLFSSLSADGRFAAFDSLGGNLVPGDTNGTNDVFVRDTCAGATGCAPSTIRVSVATDGTQGNFFSFYPSLSAGARFVAFESLANTLAPGDTNGAEDVFVRDTCLGATGCTPSTIRVSVSGSGTQANAFSGAPSISADGRFVAFQSTASNLVGGDTNGGDDVFVRDTCAGATGCTPSTIRVSVASDGTQGNSNSGTFGFLSLSANGRFVAFASDATNLVVGDTNGLRDVFVRDTCAGATGCTPSTIRASVATDGAQIQGAFNGGGYPSISADGRFVSFPTGAPLVAGDTNGLDDIYVRDTCAGATGCTPSTLRASVAANGAEGTDDSFSRTSISANGRFVAFFSFVTTFVAGDTNNKFDVYLARTGF